LAPDLRGHGDSAWSPDGAYTTAFHLYDLAQLIHQEKLEPVTLIAHSLGGAVALRFAGLYPAAVRRLVVIEGLGPSPQMIAQRAAEPVGDAWRRWVSERRALSGRLPRRYATFDQALERMRTQNRRLSEAQARHLTEHGLNRNEDGSWSWKFDNYCRSVAPSDMSEDLLHALWGAITCPTLLIYGEDSWASNPAEDGRINAFNNARVNLYADAGHWAHHDQTERFLKDVADFIA
jgi:pimeloyl-ACP methyl ester carboxylesterase